MIRTVHRAKYVLAETDLLLQDAAVHVREPGRICRVEPWRDTAQDPDVAVIDWGAAVLIPGLVNAHTHLELTGMHGRVTGFSSFPDWLGQVVRLRRDWTADDMAASVRKGAQMALASGTTLVGDITASGISASALSGAKLRRVVFEETLGLHANAITAAISSLEARLSSPEPDGLFTHGVSPHAPYSVSPDLYREVARLALNRSLPLATHLAETTAEIEFLRTGGGEFRDFLTALGVLPEDWKPPGLAPLPYVESLSVLERSPLLIHCNYLEADSIARILACHSSVVYCPRSHAFFNHGRHPVRELLDAGVNVALGTDSLASNDSLSMLDEIRFLHRTRPDLKNDEILRMATVNGAAALGFGGVLGRLRRGCWADMTALELPGKHQAKHVLNDLLEGTGECIATIVGGIVAWKRNSGAGALAS